MQTRFRTGEAVAECPTQLPCPPAAAVALAPAAACSCGAMQGASAVGAVGVGRGSVATCMSEPYMP